ncbi:MAG TPA: hypothetical protein VGP24_05040 [Glaciihabitans sp.]|jgi:hypothetical protein|nr:hypothetical protein [Glaciihabitans sp.]
MSTNLAHTLPFTSPRETENPRRIEIVTSREQRRARPRLAYALIAVGGLLGIFLAQLLLSIALSNGAYQISSLLVEKRDLGRVEGSLNEQLELAASSQNLAANAQKLGMVGTSAPAYISLETGSITGAAIAATASTVDGSRIANSLLTGLPLIGDASLAAEEAAVLAAAAAESSTAVGTESASAAGESALGGPSTSVVAGAPAATEATSSVPSNAATLPSPVTH